MAYKGYLLKVNGMEFPGKYISEKTYVVSPNQRIDLDSGRDASGVLHRSVCQHMPVKIELQTLPVDNEDIVLINSALGMTTQNIERTVEVEYYDMETDSYRTADCYMPNPQFTINHCSENNIFYDAVRYAFIEY